MEYYIEIEAIRNRVKSMGKKISQVARESDINNVRLLHLLSDDTYRMTEEEAKRLSKTLEMKLSEVGHNFRSKKRKPTIRKEKVNPSLIAIRWEDLKKLCDVNEMSRRQLSIGVGKDPMFICNREKAKNNGLPSDIIKQISRALGVEPFEFADVSKDFMDPVRKPEYKTSDDICPLPYVYDCRDMLSPVEIVKALPNIVDFEHWHKLPEPQNPHIEYKIDGMVAFRYENGNAILFTNEYIKPDVIANAMEEIKKWGESHVSLHGCNIR